MPAMPFPSVRRRPLLVLPFAALTLCSLAACAPRQDTVSETAPPTPAATAPSEASPATPADTATPAATDGMAAQCDAATAQSFVGKEATEATVADAQRTAGAKGDVRMIKPGQAVTMDYRPDRLNVEVDARNAIVRITCG